MPGALVARGVESQVDLHVAGRLAPRAPAPTCRSARPRRRGAGRPPAPAARHARAGAHAALAVPRHRKPQRDGALGLDRPRGGRPRRLERRPRGAGADPLLGAGRAGPAASFLRLLAAARRPASSTGASVPAAAARVASRGPRRRLQAQGAAARPARAPAVAGSGSRAAWPRPAVSARLAAGAGAGQRPPSAVRRCRWRSRGTALRRQNARRCIEYRSRELICSVASSAAATGAFALSVALRQLARSLSV